MKKRREIVRNISAKHYLGLGDFWVQAHILTWKLEATTNNKTLHEDFIAFM
jgi:hypothetical protein